MIRDFVQLVESQGEKKGSSDISVSIESHIMAFASKISRLEGRTVMISELV
jgi:hypothetical protein